MACVRASLQRQTLPRAAHAYACSIDGTASCRLEHLHRSASLNTIASYPDVQQRVMSNALETTDGRSNRLGADARGDPRAHVESA